MTRSAAQLMSGTKWAPQVSTPKMNLSRPYNQGKLVSDSHTLPRLSASASPLHWPPRGCTVPPQAPPRYLARIVALILVSSTQHVFGEFGKFPETRVPVHYGHRRFQQLSLHSLAETWTTRRPVRAATGLQPHRCWCTRVGPRPSGPAAQQPPSHPFFTFSQNLILHILPVIP